MENEFDIIHRVKSIKISIDECIRELAILNNKLQEATEELDNLTGTTDLKEAATILKEKEEDKDELRRELIQKIENIEAIIEANYEDET